MRKHGEVSIGSDFELPIYNYETGTFVSAIGLIGGTKHEPLSIGNGCFRQEDNVAAEFNIPPVYNLKDFKSYIAYCIEQGEAIIQKINRAYRFDILSSAYYPEEELQTSAAWEFGCEPSVCAYDEEIYAPSAPENFLRTFGFHIHIGSKQDPFKLIKKLDYFLGLPSLDMDPDKERRSIYGRAGDCRIKSYGVEYRVLGSFMLNHLDFVWEKVHEAIKSDKEVNNEIKEIINGQVSNVRIAAEGAV